MTSKALVRSTRWLNFDRARDVLRERVAATARIGEQTVRVTVEPLLRRGSGGGLEQSLRIDAPVPLSTAVVRDESGTSITRGVASIPTGLRVFIPEQAVPAQVRLALPEVSADAAIVEVGPVRHWQIHLVHHSHLDIGYTDPQGRVLAEHLSYLDSALRLVNETDGWEPDARFRWSVESLWSFEQWAANRPAALVNEFVEQVKRGRIELTAMPFNLQTEACSTDELHELLRLANDVRRRHGVSIRAAMQTDVPGCVAGLVDVLADGGVRYLSVAHNWAGRSVPHLTGGQDVPRLFWWASPAGQRVLVWVTDTPHGLAYMEGPVLGFDTSREAVEEILPSYLTALATLPYPFDGHMFGFAHADVPLHRKPYEFDLLHLRVQGWFGDNAPPRRIMSETVRQWNERWAYPHLRLSTNEDFFAEAESRYGERIPTFTGDWNDWWADGAGSGARPMQLVRRAQGTLADAQTISSIAGVFGAGDVGQDTADARAVYQDASLFDEHTWGASNPWTHGDDHQHSGEEQWHWKYHKAVAAHDGAQVLKNRAKARLSRVLGQPADVLASFYALNTAAVERRAVLRAFLPDSRIPVGVELAAVDARTGKTLPLAQWPQINPVHRDAGRFLDIGVDDVPPLGLVRIDLVAAPGNSPARSVQTSGEPVLENDHLRVEVDLAGASIRSIYAKQLDRELVSPDSTFGCNAYIYDQYGSGAAINHQSGMLEADRNLSLLGPRSLARPAALVEIGRDAVRGWLTYETSAPGATRITTTLALEHGSDRLDIVNRVDKEATMAKESGYFAFPFAAGPETVIRQDVTGSVAGTDIPQVPGGAQHMRAMRHWIALHDNDTAISWTTQDAPLVQVGDIALPYAPFPGTTPQHEPTTIYSWFHNNLWDTNYPGEQGFEMSFRYSIAATAADTAEHACVFATRNALAHTQRLSGILAAGPSTDDCPATLDLLTISDDRIRLVGVTTPEPGTLLVRLQSVAETELTVELQLGIPHGRAETATFLGRPQGEAPLADGKVTLSVGAFSTAACLLHLDA